VELLINVIKPGAEITLHRPMGADIVKYDLGKLTHDNCNRIIRIHPLYTRLVVEPPVQFSVNISSSYIFSLCGLCMLQNGAESNILLLINEHEITYVVCVIVYYSPVCAFML